MANVPVSHAAPLDDVVAAKIRASFDQQGVMTHWGARLSHLADGHCEITLPFSDKVNQQHGFFHGGVIGAIADSAGGYAGYTRLSPEQELVTAEYKLNILAPGRGGYTDRTRSGRQSRTLAHRHHRRTVRHRRWPVDALRTDAANAVPAAREPGGQGARRSALSHARAHAIAPSTQSKRPTQRFRSLIEHARGRAATRHPLETVS